MTGRADQFLGKLCELAIKLSANHLVFLAVVVGGHLSSSVTQPLKIEAAVVFGGHLSNFGGGGSGRRTFAQ